MSNHEKHVGGQPWIFLTNMVAFINFLQEVDYPFNKNLDQTKLQHM